MNCTREFARITFIFSNYLIGIMDSSFTGPTRGQPAARFFAVPAYTAAALDGLLA